MKRERAIAIARDFVGESLPAGWHLDSAYEVTHTWEDDSKSKLWSITFKPENPGAIEPAPEIRVRVNPATGDAFEFSLM